MFHYAVYLHLPGRFERIEEQEGIYIYVPVDSRKYTLYISGDGDRDYIEDISLSLEINKSGSFEFTILPSHTYYSYLRRYIHYISVEDLDDGEILFYGRIYSINMNFDGEKRVSAEGIMSNLLDCPMYNPNLTASSINTNIYKIEGTPEQLFKMAIKAYRNLTRPDIDCGTIFEAAKHYASEEIDISGGQTVGDFIMSQLIDGSGGYLRSRYRKMENGSIHTYLDWLPDPSTDGYIETINTQLVEFGVNLIDIEAEFGDDNVMTGLIPVWTDENNTKHWATQASDDIDNPGTTILKPYIVNGIGSSGIGIQMIDLPELTDQSEALTAARNYADRYCNYNLSQVEFDSFKVKALDMHYFGDDTKQKIRVYDRVRVTSDYHSINGVYTCTALEMNPEDLSEMSYTFSVYRPKASSNDKTICRQLGIKESKKRKVHNE